MRQLRYRALARLAASGGIAVLALQLVFISGCKKSSSPTSPGGGGGLGDLFPTLNGHYYTYVEYELDASDSHVSGSESYRSSTVAGGPVTVMGRSAYVVVDSTFDHNGVFESVDTLYLSKDANGDIWLSAGLIASEIPPGTPLPAIPAWLPALKQSTGVGNEYTIIAADTTITEQGISLRLQMTLTGLITAQEQVTTPAGNFNAYKGRLRITVVASVSGTTLSSTTADTYMYLAPGVGPVRIYAPTTTSPTGGSTAGSDQLLRYKNF
ncbi:MAG: hypothetical protein COS95_00305 [Ignavibacteriales bacterium CG07_land_8_20_14_0_80_59_12]|nr:MAG: hypothetical protein COS95_00305 [Ignavibacteriales bacterium CG07_land_8_20_14_0_80_59_12]